MAYKVPNHELDQPVTVLAFNEQQLVTLTGVGAGKTFTLKYDGVSTGNLGNAATAAEVQAALEGVAGIDPGDVTVTGANGGPYTVTFTGNLAGQDVPQLSGTATEGTVTVTTVQAGGPNPLAVQRGTGDADATDRTDPLDGLSPSGFRAANGSEFGDS